MVLSNVAFVRRDRLHGMMTLFRPVVMHRHRVHNSLRHILVLNVVLLSPPALIWRLLRRQVIVGQR